MTDEEMKLKWNMWGYIDPEGDNNNEIIDRISPYVIASNCKK